MHQTNPENELRRTIKFSLLSNQTLSFNKSIYLQTIKQRGVSWPLLISANQARRQILRINLLNQLFLLFKICFLDISEFCLLRRLFEYFYQCISVSVYIYPPMSDHCVTKLFSLEVNKMLLEMLEI